MKVDHQAPAAGLSGLPLVVLLACTSLTVMANATISAALPSLRDHFRNVPAIDTVAGLARTCHAHPTMSEAVKEAALAVDKRALHV